MSIRKIEDHSQTTKLHFKLYKAGKLWLVGAIASGVLVAGLSVSTTANAATNENDDNLAEVADSGTVNQKSVKLATSTADPVHSAASLASSTPDPVTLTVNAPTIPDSGSNTTTGNTNTSSVTTNPGTPGTGTTKPGKPTTPSKPTTPTKPILKAVHAPQVTPVPKHPIERPMAMGIAPAKGVQTTGGHAMTTSTNAGQLANNDTLPQTGEQNTPWLAELGLVLLALGQTLVVRRKQD